MAPKRAAPAAAKAAAATKTAAKDAKVTKPAAKAAAPKARKAAAASTKPELVNKAVAKPTATTKRVAPVAAAKKGAKKTPAPEESEDSAGEDSADEPDEAPAKPAAAKKAGSVRPKKAVAPKGPAAPKKPAATKKTAAPRKAAATKKADKAKSVEPMTDKENEDPEEDELPAEDAGKPAPKAETNAPAKAAASKTALKRKRASDADEPTPAAVNSKAGGDRTASPKVAADKEARPIKRARTVAVAPVKIDKKINSPPETVLDVFVFGEGSSGELGLGSVRYDGKKPIDVRRPRLNHNLTPDKAAVVQISCGGMHAIALTKDGRILTWGVNDQGALGRDTTWAGGLRDADAADDESDDEDDTGINPLESTPAEIDMSEVADGTRFVQVAACDSASFALTEDGRIYGWGTFRASDGIMGFSPTVRIQLVPTILPEPKKAVQIAAGANHVMVLDSAGKLMTWGCPEQNQLGRRCVQRDMVQSALRPGGVGLKRGVKVVKIACGGYHSFALGSKGEVYAWGLNNFGELAMPAGAGDSDATVLSAALVESLAPYKIADICGGQHHSVACTDDGRLLTWGRIDGAQVGLPASYFNKDNAIYDDNGKPRILKEPTVIPGLPKIVTVASGTDNSFALTEDGKAYSWGFSTNYQTGQGVTEDVEVPTLIDNTAVRGKKLIYAGAGGQYSILASAHAPPTNGTS